ncbi:MAG: TetR/AcrR family transcriptional regulator [Actinomycetota bacterium]|nr:TetR/AcrR family transcriptional regulator [Actinomycetota bacterium]
MGRPRGFREDEVLDAAADAFVRGGYEGTSIDDLVTALRLHRGSLYQAFGSKRGLFLAVLRRHIDTHLVGTPDPARATHRPELDLLLIAAVERGHCDAEVAALVRRGLDVLERAIPAPVARPSADGPRHPRHAVQLLGERLYERLLVDPDRPVTPSELTPERT